jgi:hypothetical protein
MGKDGMELNRNRSDELAKDGLMVAMALCLRCFLLLPHPDANLSLADKCLEIITIIYDLILSRRPSTTVSARIVSSDYLEHRAASSSRSLFSCGSTAQSADNPHKAP